ncbi:DUF1064 domain-containing protein [Solibacillus sp. FSL W8-0474]|uniref:DUF1064 domain-containing protein n=1 Tax=Solibacillus sp. FSL W8-0474 TaxID=2975336 RepID=UPI0030F84AE0
MRDEVRRKKKNKYKAKKVEFGGLVFDSMAEFEYYKILVQKQDAGIIRDFELQPKFELLPAFESHGKKFEAITYTADFKIIHPNGKIEIIDIKGMEPRDFPLRKKMFNYNNPELILLVLAECPNIYAEHAIDPGFIEMDKLKSLRAAVKRKRTAEAKKAERGNAE